MLHYHAKFKNFKYTHIFNLNLVNCMQQMTSTLSERDTSVCKQYLLQSTYLTNSQKVNASAENAHLWYKHKLTDVYAIHWCELHQ